MICLFSVFAFFVSLAFCNDYGQFIEPPDAASSTDFTRNEVWYLGDTKTLKWVTTLASYNVSLWQQNITDLSATQANSQVLSYTPSSKGKAGPGQYDWVVQTLEFNLNDSPVFFFGIGFSTANTGFTSHYFNISQHASSSSSSAIPSSTPPSAVAIPTKPPTPSTGATAASSIAKASDNSVATKAGLGVGLGLGIPLVLLLGVYVGIKLMSAARKQPGDSAKYPPPMYYDSNGPKHETQNVTEMPALSPDPVEMYTDPSGMPRQDSVSVTNLVEETPNPNATLFPSVRR